MALTAGKAAKRFGLSRTALLYYEEIGLVKPAGRSAAGYRLYGEQDLERLRRVLLYREAGIQLEDIAGLLNGSGSRMETVLLKRLEELNGELSALRKRQAAVVALVMSESAHHAEDGKERWHAALEEAGIRGGKAERLHADLEEHSPQLHSEFLRALGFGDDEIGVIRDYYKQK